MASASHWNLPMALIGLGMASVGLALQTWSKAVLRRNRELGVRGPYALCRHPFYLGNFVFDAGLCVLSGSLWLVAFYPLLFWAGYRRTLAYEEALMRRLFAEAHEEYCRCTPLLLPDLVGALRYWRSPCSLRVLLDERQVSRAFRLLALPLLVVFAARLWADPRTLVSPASVWLLSVAAGLGVLGRLVYAGAENIRRPGSRWSFAGSLRRFGLAGVVLAPPLLALALEQDPDDALLVGLFSVAVFAVGTLRPMLSRQTTGALRLRELLVLVAQLCLLACGLWVTQMLWLLPFLSVLLVAPLLLPGPPLLPVGFARISGIAAFAVCAACLPFAAPAVPGPEDSVGKALAHMDVPKHSVAVLEDADFADCGETPWFAGSIHTDEPVAGPGGLPGRAAFLLADADDLPSLPPEFRHRLRLEARIGYWFDEYQLLRVLDGSSDRRE